MLLTATAFGENAPKHGIQCKSGSLKYAVNFQQKCQSKRTTSFTAFTLCWRLCALHKFVVEIDTRGPKRDWQLQTL
jgi:hypothetical protein